MAHQYLQTEVGDIKAGYSFKKLRSDYTGSCFRVRRVSDDTEQDIGFSGDYADTASMTTFLGGSSGYIDTWYDQVGSVNLVQNTNSNQLRVQTNSDGYLYAVDESSNAAHRLEASGSLGLAPTWSIQVLWRCPQSALGNFTSGLEWGSNVELLAPWWTVGNGTYFRTGASEETRSWGVWEDGSFRQHLAAFSLGNATLYENGVAISDSETHASPTFNWFYVGGGSWTGSHAEFYEVIIYHDTKTAQETFDVSNNNYPEMFTYTDLFLQIGDSISSGQTAGNEEEWMLKAHNKLGTARWHTIGRGAGTLSHFITDIDEVNWFVDNNNLTISGTKTITIFLGTNDMSTDVDDQTGPQAYADLETLIAALSSNWDNIVLMTCLDRSDVGFDAKRSSFNASVLANSDAAAIVNLDSNPNLVDSTNTTYFAGDALHPNVAGATEIADTFYVVVNNLLGGDMAYTFAVRGNQINARYGESGVTGGPIQGETTAPVADAAAIGGFALDMGNPLVSDGIVWPGNLNLPQGSEISILMRLKFFDVDTSNQVLWWTGVAGNAAYNGVECYYQGGATQYRNWQRNKGLLGLNSATISSSLPLGTTNYHDILMTWDGTTTSNSFNIYEDAVLAGSLTPTRTRPTNAGNTQPTIMVGLSEAWKQSNYYLNEMVIWDEVINPSAVLLTDGSGALDGNARTTFVDVAAYDGTAASGGSGAISLGGITI